MLVRIIVGEDDPNNLSHITAFHRVENWEEANRVWGIETLALWTDDEKLETIEW